MDGAPPARPPQAADNIQRESPTNRSTQGLVSNGDDFTIKAAHDLELISYKDHEHRSVVFKFGGSRWGLIINPIATIASILAMAGFITWVTASDSANEDLSDFKSWITKKFTWIYILSQDIWFIFILAIYFSPYAKIKMGRPEDKPDFGAGTWFFMLFAAGLGIGLFFFGVAEPIFHYEPCYGSPFAATGECRGNRYATEEDNMRANFAFLLTFFHWGFHAWIVYIVVGMLLALMTYRRGMPLTMKTTFYPLLGDKIYGWIGDTIDVVSVITTMFGVVTSLGLGVMQINTGLHRLNSDIKDDTDNQTIIIWAITAVATISVATGVKLGIRRLSEITFTLGTFLLLCILFQDDTFYLLNLWVQEIGFYFQWLLKISFHTDAFQQYGESPDGKGSDGNWMDDWTIFYWGWWISWSPFVGMFIAKVSKGRTIKEFILVAFTAPVMYSFIWLAIYGGAGIRMERDAAGAGLDCGTPRAVINGEMLTRLSCRGTTDMWFDLMERYSLDNFYSTISLIGIMLYFVTSSDSGSLVIDCLTANGHPHPPIPQRIFWALMEGACATALLQAGGSEALSALRTVSIAAGLPYTFVLCWMCQSLWIVLRIEAGELREETPQFRTHLFEPIAPNDLSITNIDWLYLPARAFLAIFAPWLPLAFAAKRAWKVPFPVAGVFFGVLFYMWPLLLAINEAEQGLYIVGWVFYIFFAFAAGQLRSSMRAQGGMPGDMFTDFIASLLGYPLVAVQLHDEALLREGTELAKRRTPGV